MPHHPTPPLCGYSTVPWYARNHPAPTTLYCGHPTGHTGPHGAWQNAPTTPERHTL